MCACSLHTPLDFGRTFESRLPVYSRALYPKRLDNHCKIMTSKCHCPYKKPSVTRTSQQSERVFLHRRSYRLLTVYCTGNSRLTNLQPELSDSHLRLGELLLVQNMNAAGVNMLLIQAPRIPLSN